MKIIRWLLSHIFLFLLIVTVIYGYMFWGNLAGEDTPAGKAIAYLSDEFVEVDEFIVAIKEKHAQLTADRSSATVDKSEQSTKAGKTHKQSLAIDDSHVQPVTAKNTSTALISETKKTQRSTAVLAAVDTKANKDAPPAYQQSSAAFDKTAIAPVRNNKVSENFVPAEVARQLDNVDKQGRVLSASQKNNAIRALWITARKSFYQRNYELSEQSYRQVIEKTNDNADAYGELGNVYFNQGKNKQAAAAYFEAAAIFVHHGQANRAKSLMGLLRQLDNAKADELTQLIKSSLS